MSKLLARLSDAARSGVFWTHGDAEVRDATRGSALDVVHIDLRPVTTKAALLDAFSRALGFPHWFGGNWDALEDCLGDLSWRNGEGVVLLLEGGAGIPTDDLGVLRDILESCAQSWAARGKPFFAAFVGDDNPMALPELFRRRA
ncbi:MAG: barstar family protein [Burkholderiales bacterium]